MRRMRGQVCRHLVPQEPHASAHGRETFPLQTLRHELLCGRRSVLPQQKETRRGWAVVLLFYVLFRVGLLTNLSRLYSQVKCTAVSIARPRSHSPSNWPVTSARTQETNRTSAENVGRALSRPTGCVSICRTFTVRTSTYECHVTLCISQNSYTYPRYVKEITALHTGHPSQCFVNTFFHEILQTCMTFFCATRMMFWRTLITRVWLSDLTEPHDCQKCRVSFSSLDELRQHIQEVHPKELHQCPDCSKIFNSEANLEKHMTVHDGSKPYSCQTCSKCYQVQTSLIYSCQLIWSEQWCNKQVKPWVDAVGSTQP